MPGRLERFPACSTGRRTSPRATPHPGDRYRLGEGRALLSKQTPRRRRGVPPGRSAAGADARSRRYREHGTGGESLRHRRPYPWPHVIPPAPCSGELVEPGRTASSTRPPGVRSGGSHEPLPPDRTPRGGTSLAPYKGQPTAHGERRHQCTGSPRGGVGEQRLALRGGALPEQVFSLPAFETGGGARGRPSGNSTDALPTAGGSTLRRGAPSGRYSSAPRHPPEHRGAPRPPHGAHQVPRFVMLPPGFLLQAP